MKALVISGGGSKGAFAGGVAEYLIREEHRDYDIYIGTSTGSLLISHLALGKTAALKEIYTNVSQRKIFNNSPFLVKKVHGEKIVKINHFNVLWNLIRRRKTFGESKNLLKNYKKNFLKSDFQTLKDSDKEVIVTVSNLTKGEIEYKTIRENGYDDFCEWVWASCNYIPFMSLLEKDNCQYADGGFGSLVPIQEAIKRGATEIDVIILETEVTHFNRLPAKNPFSLISNLFEFILGSVEKHNVTIGKLYAKNKNVKLNMYYTPTVLTMNSLIFDKKKMALWWNEGYAHAKKMVAQQLTHVKYDR